MIPREEAKVILGGNSLAVQQLDAALPMQGAHVQSLVRELRSHSPLAIASEPAHHNERSHVPQLRPTQPNK